ncbi:TraB/GumN family protein [Rhizobium sp. RU36D]|uniref:TraB/GumN family protein n=1 Tax=Rhizobium sp. RU36D TaxID=1907415 RepID=UPI0009D7FEC1|nr:TraB/GumN family protein [Rhizobium sp. RU36D]SMC77237.1 hypothetical protein SAMN05880593_106151 [Rhizobium sp. RU36D]
MTPDIAQIARDALDRRPGEALLWLLGAFHVALLASIVVILTFAAPAYAEDAAAECGGRDLLAEMRASDPARYAALEAEARKVPNGKGLLWKVEKIGIPASYLLGTMHITDPRVVSMPPAARVAAAGASTVVIESDEILDEKKASMAMLTRPDLTMFTDGTTLSDHLSPEDAKTLENGLKSRGVSLASVSRMKPWILSSFIALPACELSRKSKGASFLDKKIAEDAVAAGKKLVGLETLAEQLQAMADLPVEFHLKALIETLQIGDSMKDIMETMTALYLAGETGMTMPMLKAVTKDLGGDPEDGYAAFETRMVIDRNKVMAERSAPILAEGNAFIAVGALHLPGDQGLVELLRAQGFQVTAVEG